MPTSPRASGSHFTSAVWIFWVLLGIVPALLAVTGLIMYWNRKLRPAWLRMAR
jgi:hypothetical protein